MQPMITMVLMTCGEETEEDCLKSIEPFKDKISLKEVRNICPQIKALNQMISLVETEFFVPLDSDMILEKNAYERIRNAIERHKHDEKWHSILFPLWDTLTEKKILALKILRTKIAKEHMFLESATPDVEHYQRLTNLGFTCIHDYLKQSPIGNHVVKGHHFCYHKYRDVYLTYRAHNFEWDSGAFMGGTDLLSRAKSHFDYFLLKYLKTDNDDYLSCIAGMVDGIVSPADNKSKSLDHKDYLIKKEEAVSCFYDWYINSIKDRYYSSDVI